MYKKIEPKDGQEVGGYAGKILRIDLTSQTASTLPTSTYCPEYIGGWATCNAIWWDEVPGKVDALSSENKIIYMLGPGTATGVPFMNRATLCGVSPANLPEQYTHSNMGGYFGPALKWAGYDGIIVEGAAAAHTYVLIEDDRVTFHDADADGLWGLYVHESQHRLSELYGKDCFSLVIGPAGEHQHRNASIASGNDSVSAQAGFGAVWGFKNLKAIACIGTGTAAPSCSYDELMDIRLKQGFPLYKPNPLVVDKTGGLWGRAEMPAPEGQYWYTARLSCSQGGCNATCMRTWFEQENPLGEEKVTQLAKCVEMFANNYKYDCGVRPACVLHSKKQVDEDRYLRMGVFQPLKDPGDPVVPWLQNTYGGDEYDMREPNYSLGMRLTWLCVQYGLDKWDVDVWYMTWLALCDKEGLLDGIDFGMPIDVNSVEFMEHFMRMMVYREGPDITLPDGTVRPIGDLFAEGMARAIRALGKEKFGDTIYHGRYNVAGDNLEIPVSFETGWGHCSHWLGRGFQGTLKTAWLGYELNEMSDTRPSKNNGHLEFWYEDYLKIYQDPEHSELLARVALTTSKLAFLKDSLPTCEWRTPNLGRPDQEAVVFNAATGLHVSEGQLLEACARARLMYRAILMRDFGRDRALETAEVFPWMTYPDPWGETTTWEDWNDLVDLFYGVCGYDLQTGWPTRSTWERYDLGFIADEMGKIGKLPPEGRTEYERMPNPCPRDGSHERLSAMQQ